ncbi:MAG TPA: MFS transporter [Microbacteriaceae bacterium]|nr:MFS transporter [Microbacteriaceae bacterium]
MTGGVTNGHDARPHPHDPGGTPAGGGWPGHPAGSTGYRRIVAALFLGGIATFAQLYSPQAALPEIGTDLHIGAATSSLMISAATLGLAAGVIPWSAVADRFGRVRAMATAMISATVFGLAVPFLPQLWMILTGRFLEGLFIGGVPAIAIAYLTEEVDRRHAARVAGMYVAGTSLGGLTGRLIAGPVADAAGWRAAVFLVALISALAAAGFVAMAPAARGFTPGRTRAWAGLARRLAGNLRSPTQLALYAQGLTLMGGFVAMYNYLTFRLTSPPFSLPVSVTSLIFLAYLAGTWSSTRAGALASRIGRLPVLAGSATLFAAGVAVTLIDWLPAVLAGLVVATAGFFGAHSVASGWTGAAARVGRAQASSLYNLFYYVGSSVFGWAGGLFFSWAGWPGATAMIVALALVAIGTALAVLRHATTRAA